MIEVGAVLVTAVLLFSGVIVWARRNQERVVREDDDDDHG